ncbi:MAG: diguanylate cyclase [Mycobacteriales bacterium]
MPDPTHVVIVADDSPTVRAVVRMQLETAGYDVIEVEDGSPVVDLAKKHDPTVILLDVDMPVLDGHQTLAALKADPLTRDVPVVFLSSRAAGGDVAVALHQGAHDYLRKPPEPHELLARVAVATRMKQLQDELRARAAELEQLSRTDHLTGLSNRRHTDERLHGALSSSTRHGEPVAVLIIDVDHFKAVNDNHGHAHGDKVLVNVAAVLSNAARAEDIVGRWGGEEFMVVAPHCNAEQARALAERLRTDVEANTTVTVSIGGASTHGPGTGLLSEADTNLYAAKAAGRNQCILTDLV